MEKRPAFPQKFEFNSQQEQELTKEIIKAIADFEGFEVDDLFIEEAINWKWGMHPDPKINKYVITAQKILDRVEEILNEGIDMEDNSNIYETSDGEGR